jgi:hypothetical protein
MGGTLPVPDKRTARSFMVRAVFFEVNLERALVPASVFVTLFFGACRKVPVLPGCLELPFWSRTLR